MKYVLLITLLISGISFSQGNKADRKEKREKIEQLKIAYITKKLNLTTKEAEKFWPVYNTMQSEIKTIKKDRRTSMKELNDLDSTASDAEVKVIFEKIQSYDQKALDSKKAHLNSIAEIIGYRRVHALLEAERGFKKELLRELKERKEKRSSHE